MQCACASAPVAPRIDIFGKQVPTSIVMPAPATLPARPIAKQVHDVDGDVFAFTPDGAQRLVARDQVCEANTEIAAQCSAGYNDLQRSDQLLLKQAQLLEAQHNYMAERWAQAEGELQKREREQLVETWLARILLVGLAVHAAE